MYRIEFSQRYQRDHKTVWLTQSQMVDLFEATKQNISLHINNVYKERELDPASTVKEYLTVRHEGIRKVKRKLLFYNLDDGQIFDAWTFVSKLIKSAKRSIILIDNYIDESVLALLAKRQAGVKASIYTASLSPQMKHDLQRHNK